MDEKPVKQEKKRPLAHIPYSKLIKLAKARSQKSGHQAFNKQYSRDNSVSKQNETLSTVPTAPTTTKK